MTAQQCHRHIIIYPYWHQRVILLHQNTRLPKLLYTYTLKTPLKIPVPPLPSLLRSAGKMTRENVRGATANAEESVVVAADVDKSEAILLTPACTDTDPLVAAPGPHDRPMDASPSEGVPIGRSGSVVGPGGRHCGCQTH